MEYLVTGCGALPRIALATGISANHLASLTTQQLGLLLPVVYVIGMFVDSIMSLVLRRVKHVVRGELTFRELFSRKEAVEQPESQLRTASIVLESADLGRELQLRSSRDRIARGALLNVLLFGAIALASPGRLNDVLCCTDWSRWSIAVTTVLVGALAFAWWHYEYNTHAFKRGAIKVLERKRAKEG